jgi:hypothetical protein
MPCHQRGEQRCRQLAIAEAGERAMEAWRENFQPRFFLSAILVLFCYYAGVGLINYHGAFASQFLG